MSAGRVLFVGGLWGGQYRTVALHPERGLPDHYSVIDRARSTDTTMVTCRYRINYDGPTPEPVYVYEGDVYVRHDEEAAPTP